ncbi:hypothetical protein PSHI_09930 [Pseudomonas sp. URMO17WK12:I11]|nr:hypothetical protein PSHI_09930 [Pseudomonas sp. URMO17WK12:I11]
MTKKAYPVPVKIYLLRNIGGDVFILEIKNVDDVLTCRLFSQCHLISNSSITHL